MVVFAGVIGEKIKLALFSHVFDKNLRKMIVANLIVESEDDEFPLEEYELNGTLDTQKMIFKFLEKYYINQPKNEYGEGIEQEILCICMAVTGPVEGEKDHRIASLSRKNLEVTFSEPDFQKPPISYAPVALINDMPAIGLNVFLPEYESDFTPLDEKRKVEEQGLKGLLLVEGGLGASVWYPNTKYLSSEYGHTIFSPRTEREEIISQVLRKHRPQNDGINQAISKEYALSGPGLVRIYEILKTPTIYNPETGELHYSEDVGDLPERLKQSNSVAPQSLIEQAINKSDSFAVKSLEIFVGIMGSIAGDLALIYQTKGGIYIGGYPNLFKLLKTDVDFKEVFLKAFDDREKAFQAYNEAVPVLIYDFEGSTLKGAARYAVEQGLVTKGKFAKQKKEKEEKEQNQ